MMMAQRQLVSRDWQLTSEHSYHEFLQSSRMEITCRGWHTVEFLTESLSARYIKRFKGTIVGYRIGRKFKR